MFIVGKFLIKNVIGKIVQSISVVFKKNLFFFFLIILAFLVDRFTKIYILEFFLNQKVDTYYLNPYLNLSLIWNTGIAFGMLNSDGIIYTIISILITCIIIFLLIYMQVIENKLEKLSISIIVGGALGNLYDRVVFRAVPDFIDIHYSDFHWFVFNVSDIFVTIGVILLLAKDILRKNVK